jgi:hypothetical protein
MEMWAIRSVASIPIHTKISFLSEILPLCVTLTLVAVTWLNFKCKTQPNNDENLYINPSMHVEVSKTI